MKSEKLLFMGLLVLAAIILIIVLWIMAIIGAMDVTDGCLYRYNFAEDGSVSSASSVSTSVQLKANANYSSLSSEIANKELPQVPSDYGQWMNSNVRVSSGQEINYEIKGEVSLCKAYLPKFNLQSNDNKDIDNDLIPIPRVEDKVTPAVSLIFDAKTYEWRNIAEVFNNDKIVVSLVADKKSGASSSSVVNTINKGISSADCREGESSYSPICGRYSIWGAAEPYVDTCELIINCYQCNPKSVCQGWDIEIIDVCIGGYETEWDSCSCYGNVDGVAPEPYQTDGKYTSPRFESIPKLMTNFNRDCKTERAYIEGEYQDKKYFWFSADNAAGLLYRFDGSENPSNKKTRGDFEFAKIEENQSYLDGNKNSKLIMNLIYEGAPVSYLQYRFHDNDGSFADNTGGYVLNVKQTKCRRADGISIEDTEKRGAVQYVVSEFGHNPNNDMSGLTVRNMTPGADGKGSLAISGDTEGYIWIKIENNQGDYKDSVGQYRVDFFTQIDKGWFYTEILDPFFGGLKESISSVSVTIFKNMTCYKGIGGEGNCTNFFNYIKAMLIMYIMLFGMMFLLGMVQISQTDLVIRVIKVALVSGLMNDSTFEFFNTYVFDFVTGFSDSIISNMAGYSLFSGSTSVSNPFMFLNEVMTKIFMSPIFAGQMMALLSMGLNGVMYFILLFVCIGIVIVVAFRAIAVYLMAFMAISVLISLAPLFLTFILFEQTRSLFDNWVKFMFRYMLEPVILLAGIIILTQLFTIYLDSVIGYSVCWKCALPFKIPFPSIEGITPAFLDVELFCINWFTPWGFDHRSSQMGLNMQNMVVLLMLAYCMWGYLDFSSTIVGTIAGGVGPSATGMGNAMSGSIESKALKSVGLDAQSRKGMADAAKGRLKAMRAGGKQTKLSKEGRHDKEKTEVKPEEKKKDSGIKIGSHRGKEEAPLKKEDSGIKIGSHRGKEDPQLKKEDGGIKLAQHRAKEGDGTKLEPAPRKRSDGGTWKRGKRPVIDTPPKKKPGGDNE